MERKTKLDEALVTGYEKLANDCRAWFTPERRARYAMEAIRQMETAEIKLKGQSERVARLKKPSIDAASLQPRVDRFLQPTPV